MPSSFQNVPMSNNGAVGSDIEEKLSNLSVEKASYPSEMFRKERASFKLNKSSKGKKDVSLLNIAENISDYFISPTYLPYCPKCFLLVLVVGWTRRTGQV